MELTLSNRSSPPSRNNFSRNSCRFIDQHFPKEPFHQFSGRFVARNQNTQKVVYKVIYLRSFYHSIYGNSSIPTPWSSKQNV